MTSCHLNKANTAQDRKYDDTQENHNGSKVLDCFVVDFFFSFKGIVQYFVISCRELDEKINTTLMFVR